MWTCLRRRFGRQNVNFFSDLPEEVLPLIFKQLSVSDRKIVKLVCRSWLYICNQPSLINDEVINCSRSDSLYDIYEYLDKSSHKLLNLKFHQLHFYNYDDLTFWKNNGHRIRSIIIKNCDMDRSILEKIIMFCPNSLHLAIIMKTYHSGFEKLREVSADFGSTPRQNGCDKVLYSEGYKALDPSESLLLDLLLSNSRLRRLKIGPFVDSKIEPVSPPTENVESILQHSRNSIQHLRCISKASYNDLQLVSKYQRKLKSLELYWLDDYSKEYKREALKVFKKAFRRLKDLEYLKCNVLMAKVFLKSLSPRSVLVNLKYLHINLSGYPEKMMPSDLLRLADAMPFLEGLYLCVDLETEMIPYHICRQLCAKLRKLRFFRAPNGICFEDVPYYEIQIQEECLKLLFSVCPSLRVLYNDEDVFYFNIVSKKIERSCHTSYSDYNKYIPWRTFAEPKVGGYVIDWLEF